MKNRLVIFEFKNPSVKSVSDLKEIYISTFGLNLFFHLQQLLKLDNVKTITLREYQSDISKWVNFNKYIVVNEPNFFDLVFYKLRGIVPLMMYCGESPINSLSYHIRLKLLDKYFLITLGFKGVFNLFNIDNRKIEFNWPIQYYLTQKIDFDNRKLLVYIVSSKSKYPANFRLNFSRAIRYFRYFKRRVILLLLSSKLGKDLSDLRFKIIKDFSGDKDFYLKGRGWQEALSCDSFFSSLSFYNFPEDVTNKREVLSNYKFSLCFENTDFPGYVTEKILDSLLSLCVPIYLGNAEIERIIPSGCFISYNSFTSNEHLMSYLKNMTRSEWEFYISNITKYICSREFKDRFSDHAIAQKCHNEFKEVW